MGNLYFALKTFNVNEFPAQMKFINCEHLHTQGIIKDEINGQFLFCMDKFHINKLCA